MSLARQFSKDFQTLNRVGFKDGPEPLKWQFRMFERLFALDIPKVCDIPTGMGKTSIISLWALALWYQTRKDLPRLPIRLVYVVDRRTVVDQATELAERIQRNISMPGWPDRWLSVSTLRGRFADNRDWTRDLSRPAIVIGTVDMIGSRLLFSGYRSSYKLRPLDAGLLGQDSLLVLDEAHLSRPFQKLVRALDASGEFQRDQGRPMRVMSMSATVDDDTPSRFKLEEADLAGDMSTNPIVRRYRAKKRLVLSLMEKSRIRHSVVEGAAQLAQRDNARVVVFTRSPDEANRIATELRKRVSEGTVEVLTGTMRGLERDELLAKAVMKRFLDGEEKPEDRSNKHPAVLVSTSAGEVGFDLNADHMICDAAPLDSLIQRLGRVNRRGFGDANIRLFASTAEDKSPDEKKKSPSRKTWESAAAAALKCLEELRPNEDGTLDASPEALDQLKSRISKDKVQAALSPTPDTLDLTDILLDVWSMTTIAERLPGRPPVGPWLRGVTDEEPQTTIAWRSELDIEGFDVLDVSDFEDWFDAHRLLPHETLSVPATHAREWILKRWERLTDKDRITVGSRPCIVDRNGLQVLSLKSLVDDLTPKPPRSEIANASLTIPASFGGIERYQGLLDADAPKPIDTASGMTNNPYATADVADADGERYRVLRNAGAECDKPLAGMLPEKYATFSQFVVDLSADGDAPRQLISLIPKRERPEYGTARQSLQMHVSLVEKYARELAGRLLISEDIWEALRLAAEWHDKGKDREVWQRAVGRRSGEDPVGKSGGVVRRVAGGYRHEFGSLREFANAFYGTIGDDLFDLAMHLIAVHHGRGRPHFPKGGFDPHARAESGNVAAESIRRFARLQRKYGYWQLAWLENLLRCADAMASSEMEPL